MSYSGIDEAESIPFSELALPKRYFKNLLRLQTIFVGRESEVKQVTEFLEFGSDIHIVGIFGGPGFGKSTFAIHVCHQLIKNFNTTIEYYDLSEVSYVQHLVHRILGSSLNVTDDLSVLEELKHWADSVNTNTVMLFDGCDILFKDSQKAEFQKIIELLIEHSKYIKVLFTSRYVVSFLNAFKSVTMNELEIKDAAKLLRKYAPSASEEVLEKMTSLVGNVPLALQVVGALLETQRITPETVIDELSENPIEALKLDGLPRESQINTSLQLSYRRLDKFTQSCARCLANFPGSFSKDAVFSVVNFMINKTYWYAKPLIESNIFLHWLPKPSACINTLVHHSLLKHHSTSNRYSFHKLIREFFLHIQSEEGDLEKEKAVFKVGFFNYFVDYWNSFHSLVKRPADTTSILAALDVERHNFELMEDILPDFGHDLQYVHSYISLGVVLATSYEDSAHIYGYLYKRYDVEEGLKQIQTYNVIISIIDCHSKIAIKERGIQDYMKMYVELMLQRFEYEEYLQTPEKAFENLISRRHRITELYQEHGDAALEGVKRYFNKILDYSLRIGNIDGYIEALRVTITLKKDVNTSKFNSKLEKGLLEFSTGNYENALKSFKSHIKTFKQSNKEFLYTKILMYYCFKFMRNEEDALKLIKELDQFSLSSVELKDMNREYLHVAYSFYKQVLPGSSTYKFLSILPSINPFYRFCSTEDCNESYRLFDF